jgi:hypothetical protein
MWVEQCTISPVRWQLLMDQSATATSMRLHCTAGLYANNFHPFIMGAVYTDNPAYNYPYTPPKNFLEVCICEEMHDACLTCNTLHRTATKCCSACMHVRVLWVGCSLQWPTLQLPCPAKARL